MAFLGYLATVSLHCRTDRAHYRHHSGFCPDGRWCHPERHRDEFAHPADFAEYRNRIGGLLLLPKSFNASYGDKPYAEKREHYFGQNLLAQSLHETAYEHNPGFRKFRERGPMLYMSRRHRDFRCPERGRSHCRCRRRPRRRRDCGRDRRHHSLSSRLRNQAAACRR